MLEGGCFCGAVRYQINGHLQAARACHCSRCRKAFSGASSAYAALSGGSTLTWESGAEQLARYRRKNDWGLAFCGVCGSTLCGILNGTIHGVALGNVDGDPGVGLALHLLVASKAPWDHIGGDAGTPTASASSRVSPPT
ncbi:GFA family protein [Candidatus Accumulibacter sp. ACC007]|uniref:GFA family protein n=1 Tax=Candidatus Accumulibacter sp. ACC007 TaxID=2823333 RepID=UPI0025BEA716|nr:GFA family protein [Candidatus Accumulibacter sp. ACC007]